MEVIVVYSPAPRITREWTLRMPDGATAAQALAASGLLQEFPALRGDTVPLAIWGRAKPSTTALHEGDRIEVLRPLKVDPKTARRERFRSQGTRAAGLFARKKAGPAAGC